MRVSCNRGEAWRSRRPRSEPVGLLAHVRRAGDDQHRDVDRSYQGRRDAAEKLFPEVRPTVRSDDETVDVVVGDVLADGGGDALERGRPDDGGRHVQFGGRLVELGRDVVDRVGSLCFESFDECFLEAARVSPTPAPVVLSVIRHPSEIRLESSALGNALVGVLVRSERGFSMATHVLVPLDGSPQSWAAFDYAVSNYDGGAITTLHVVDPIEGMYGDYDSYYDAQAYERALERGDELGDQARDRADDAGILETTVLESVVETGQPARTILEYVDENDVDHIVIGSHGRSGVARILLGSVAETVIRRAPVPVTVVR